MSIVHLARPEIRRLKPYEAAVQVADTIRLNANEAPWTSSADSFRRPLNRYPEVRPERLRQVLAERYGCTANQLLVTRGSSEAIDLIVRAFCRAGMDNIVTTAPTFSMYQHYAEIQGAEIRQVTASANDNFAIDVDRLLAACDDDTRIIFACSPNNPTGALLSRSDLLALLKGRGNRSAIVVDEAYIEFAGETSAVELVERYENLVVLRTLSKALAHAGARCGAVIGAPDVIAMLNAVQAPYALATPVVECVEDVLEAETLREAEQNIAETVAERERLVAEIGRFSFVRRVFPSAANFFLVEVDNASALLEACTRQKVLLRYFGNDLADCVRITVGSAADNERLLQVLAALDGD